MTTQPCHTPQPQAVSHAPSFQTEMEKIKKDFILMTKGKEADSWTDSFDADAQPGKPVDAALAELQKAFDPVAEIVIIGREELKVPEPLAKAWESYQSAWTGRGIYNGLVIVRRSRGLVALVFADSNALAEFASRNPWAKESLMTTTLGRPTVWFRAAGQIPENQRLIGVDLIATGDIPVARSNPEQDEFLVRPGVIPAIDFHKIIWDEKNLGVIRFAAMEAVFGRAYLRLGPRKRVLNETFWGRWLAKELSLIYDTHALQFYHASTKGKPWQPLNTSQVFTLISLALQESAKLAGSAFPRDELRLPRIRRIADSVKVAAAVTPPTDHENLRSYVAARLRPRQGGNLTIKEIYGDFSTYSVNKKRRVVPLCFFQRELPRQIRDRFSLTRVHNVKRPRADGRLTHRRGFNGLGFADDKGPRSDTADSKDGLDGVVGVPSPGVLE